MSSRRVRPGLAILAFALVLALPLVLLLAGCSTPEPSASPSRFLTIETVGVVVEREELPDSGPSFRYRNSLDGGRTLDVKPAGLDQITGPPLVGDQLLLGTGDRPWIMRVPRIGTREPACYALGYPAFDCGATVQVDLGGEGILTLPKAPGYENLGTDSCSEILQKEQCVDSLGRALGWDAG